VGAYFLQPLSP